MSSILADLSAELESIRAQSLWKTERPILSPQSSHVDVGDHRMVLNFCANNYLGLADHPALIAAAKEALDKMVKDKEVGEEGSGGGNVTAKYDLTAGKA